MYLWIVIIGGLFAFFAAMGIGANDVANAYATAVGSKALTMRQAVGLAAICETGGAVLMGSHVSETIRKGIADYQCFESQPELLMYGCMWVVLSVGLWLFLASFLEMPVSTTHSCVGGMIGMAWALGGSNCVIWYAPLSTFPYIGGVGGIVLSWFFSPVLSAVLASSLFYGMRLIVLRNDYENSARIYILYPVLVGTTITMNTFFIIYKGAKGLGLHKTELPVALGISFGTGLVSSLAVIPYIPRLRNKIDQLYIEGKLDGATNDEENVIDPSTLHNVSEATNVSGENNEVIDITNNKFTDNKVQQIHDTAEKFDIRTEETFKYLQVFTAMCDSFSHGANDVANAIGPFAAIYTIYQVGDVRKNSVMDDNAYWILALGGVGISFGLLIYGYKIMQTIGLKLCKITPSRGVAIELSSALVIITGSRLEIPLSTTHCQIGATIGVAALEDPHKCSGINGKILIRTIVGWILTLVVVGTSCGILTAQGVYAPEI